MKGFYCPPCAVRATVLARWRDEADSIRQTCLFLGLLGLYLHLAMLVELADECHAYVEDYFATKWDLTSRLLALRSAP